MSALAVDACVGRNVHSRFFFKWCLQESGTSSPHALRLSLIGLQFADLSTSHDGVLDEASLARAGLKAQLFG